MSNKDDEMPGMAVGAIAAGTAPLPFLLIYSILFILRGTLVPVTPPDVTTTQHGEAVAGLVAFAYLVVIGIYRFMSQRGRWLMMRAKPSAWRSVSTSSSIHPQAIQGCRS